MTEIRVGIILAGFTTLITILAFLLRNAIFGKLEALSKDIDSIKKDFVAFREDVIRSYVTKDEVTSHRHDNTQAHKEFWTEISNIKQRVTKIEP